MGLLLREGIWGEDAAFTSIEGQRGEKIDWLLEFEFNWLYSYTYQHSRRRDAGRYSYTFCILLLDEKRSVWLLQGMSRKELAPEKRGQAAGWEMGEEWVWGPCFWLSFLSSFSPDALQLVLRRRFVLFHCGLGYLCWAAQCHFQSFLIAEECHFQWTGFRFYWIFPERFNRIWGDQISICKTSDLVLFTSDLFTAELVACGNSTVPADLSAPSTLPQHILLAGEEGLGPGNAEKLW